jgi:D-proline reductase (dithiol) PrdB
MIDFGRLKNRALASLFTKFPSLGRKAANKVESIQFEDIPWTPVPGPLSELKMSLVTTAGVHLKSDTPFDMVDKTGDPTLRVIPASTAVADIMITHDYYDHKDADNDINIVFPIERLKEYVTEGRIGSLSDKFYGFMGHIIEGHIDTFINEEVPKVSKMMKEDGVDVALLLPG